MKIGNLEVNNPLALGPMAGVTDWAFRNICAEMGANITVTEMVSSRALVYKDQKSAKLLKKNEGSICGAQIFGNDPQIMAEGARLAMEISGCDFIDINMGCPMPKIANSGDGCGLMRTPELAGEILSAVVKAVDVPVTIKCRLGWDKGNINVLDFTKRMEDNGAAMVTVHGRTRSMLYSGVADWDTIKKVKDQLSVPVTVKCRLGWDKGSINVLEFTRRMEDNGAAMIAVHGRTRSMLYSGVADWDTIRKVKEQLSVPVIANGDIVSGETAVRCRKWTGADGVMIGRATFGDPWIFSQAKAALAGEEIPERPALAQRVDVAVRQFELAFEDKGEKIACLEARKHFAWYLRGVSHSNYYKEQISAISKMEDIYRIAEGIRKDLK